MKYKSDLKKFQSRFSCQREHWADLVDIATQTTLVLDSISGSVVPLAMFNTLSNISSYTHPQTRPNICMFTIRIITPFASIGPRIEQIFVFSQSSWNSLRSANGILRGIIQRNEPILSVQDRQACSSQPIILIVFFKLNQNYYKYWDGNAGFPASRRGQMPVSFTQFHALDDHHHQLQGTWRPSHTLIKHFHNNCQPKFLQSKN